MEQVTKLASKLKLELKEQQEKYLTRFMDSLDDMRQRVIALKGELDAVYAPEIAALRLDIQALQQGHNPTLTNVHPSNPLQMPEGDSTATLQCDNPPDERPLQLQRIISTADPPSRRERSEPPDPNMKDMLQAITQAITTISCSQNQSGGNKVDARNLELPKLAPLSNIHAWNANLMDGQAYHVWSTLVKMRLQSKGVAYVLDTDPPAATDKSYTTWRQHDSLVFTVLTEALPSKEQSRFIHLSQHADAARRVWKGISELYFRTSQYDYMKLQDELRKFKPLPGENMVEYLARADELHRKFTTYAVPVSEAEFSGQI